MSPCISANVTNMTNKIAEIAQLETAVRRTFVTHDELAYEIADYLKCEVYAPKTNLQRMIASVGAIAQEPFQTGKDSVVANPNATRAFEFLIKHSARSFAEKQVSMREVFNAAYEREISQGNTTLLAATVDSYAQDNTIDVQKEKILERRAQLIASMEKKNA
jgi:hypothetical protein